MIYKNTKPCKNNLLFVTSLFVSHRFVLAATCWSWRWTTGRATTWPAPSAGPSSAGFAWKKFQTFTTSVHPAALSGEKSLGNFLTKDNRVLLDNQCILENCCQGFVSKIEDLIVKNTYAPYIYSTVELGNLELSGTMKIYSL